MDEKINIRAIVRKLTSKWYFFLVSLVIMLPLAYLYTEFADSIYQVRASILLDGQVKNGMGPEKFLKGMELLTSHTEIEDEIGILKSFNLVGSTVQKLDFGISYFEKKNFKVFERYGPDYPFKIELDSTVNHVVGVPIYIKRTSPSAYSVLAIAKNAGTYNYYINRSTDHVSQLNIDQVAAIDKPFVHKNLSFKIRFNSPYDPSEDEKTYFFILHDLTSLTEAYREMLDIKPISRESNIVEINIRGRIPQKEVLFLNTLLDVYITNELYKRNQLGLKTISFIDEQLSGVSNELRQAEGSLESFRSRNNILNINATAENLTKNLDRLETDRSALELKLRYYRYIAGALDNGDLKSIQTPSTFGLEDPLLNNLLLELSRLTQERIGLNYSTKANNPVVEVLDLKIANYKKALIENVDNFIEASTNALADLNRQISELQRNVKGLPKSERELVSIQRKFDFNDNVYNYLLEKRAEAGIAIASNTVEKTIVDRAQQVGGGAVSPNKRLILFLAILGSLLASIGLIIMKDLINDSIVTTEDIEKSTRIPFIGTIVHGSRRDRSSVIVANAKSALGESFRSLRVNLQYLTLGKEKNVIGVTSSVESEGKTFCSSNLAVSMAHSGKRTILIDADMRRPRVATAFKLENVKGLSNFLIGTCSVEEVINSTDTEGLDVITSGPIPPNPLDLIGLPKMEQLIDSLKQVYDIIIIDTPPVGPVSEYIILMKYTNATICVIRSNYTNRNHLEKINKLYNEKKIKNLSVVLNDARVSLNGYSYTYG